MTAIAHVDDFLVTGPRSALLELRTALQTEYEVDGTILGPRATDGKEAKFLG